jgi:hypothetical protein
MPSWLARSPSTSWRTPPAQRLRRLVCRGSTPRSHPRLRSASSPPWGNGAYHSAATGTVAPPGADGEIVDAQPTSSAVPASPTQRASTATPVLPGPAADRTVIRGWTHAVPSFPDKRDSPAPRLSEVLPLNEDVSKGSVRDRTRAWPCQPVIVAFTGVRLMLLAATRCVCIVMILLAATAAGAAAQDPPPDTVQPVVHGVLPMSRA